MVFDPKRVASLYEHPLISVLYRGRTRKKHSAPASPVHPSRSFALALFDVAVRGLTSWCWRPASQGPRQFIALFRRGGEARCTRRSICRARHWRTPSW